MVGALGAKALGVGLLADGAGLPAFAGVAGGSALDADDPAAAAEAGTQLALPTFLRRGRLAAVGWAWPEALCPDGFAVGDGFLVAGGFVAGEGFVACGALSWFCGAEAFAGWLAGAGCVADWPAVFPADNGRAGAALKMMKKAIVARFILGPESFRVPSSSILRPYGDSRVLIYALAETAIGQFTRCEPAASAAYSFASTGPASGMWNRKVVPAPSADSKSTEP